MPRVRPTALSLSMVSILILSTLCFAQQAPVLVTQPVDNSVRTVLKGTVHPLARAEYDQGEVPASMALHRILLVLKRSDQQEAALRDLIENQQFKKSPSYHQWLTPQQFGAQFGLADSDLAAVVNWLGAGGFAVNQVSNGRIAIEFNGTAGLVKQAFGTALHRYVVNGEEHIANSTNISIPTALAPVIAGVHSLHDFRPKAQSRFVGKYSEKTKQFQPVPGYTFTYKGNTYYAVTPYDFATIYDVLPLWNATPAINGTGQTIAIVGETDIDPTDATDFWNLFGLDGVHAPQPTLNIIYNGPNPGFTGDEPEANVDVQWSGAVAPGATIDFVTSESTETDYGFDLSALYIVDNNLAPVMSESYGICEASGYGTFYGPLWEQAAAQGISVMVAAGDNGSAGCDDPNSTPAAQYGANVNAIASTPWNAAVGGTDFNEYNQWSTYWNATNQAVTQESAKGYIPETTWDDSCTNPLLVTLGYGANAEAICNNGSGFLDIWAGSGGYSGSGLGSGYGWPKPTWQTGTPHDSARDLPDVSLFASDGFVGSFYIICEKDLTGGACDLNNFDFLTGGGTSFASPAFAGIMALVNQKMALLNQTTSAPQGVPGLILYTLASAQPSAFHDINTDDIDGQTSTTTNSVPCYSGSTTDCITNVGTDAYGVLQSGGANEYNTGPAYDRATGLGSIDAANLVNLWSTVTFTPSTTALKLNGGTGGINIVHGTGVQVNATTKPKSGSGTPTGDVALLVNPGTPGNPGIDVGSLASGVAKWTTFVLPGGTYGVIAHYAGDTTYGGSYSNVINATVTPEGSQVYLPGVLIYNPLTGTWSPGTSVTYGTGAADLYMLRADVRDLNGDICNPQQEFACPTGTMTFTDNGNPLDGGTFKLNSLGYTEDQGIQLTGGSHTLIGSYGGDASFNPSSNGPGGVVITVSPAATTIADVAVNPTTQTVNQPFTVTATVSTASYGVAPTGTVTFYANGTALSGAVQYTPTNGNPSSGITAALAASLTTSISTAGTYTITAAYVSADNNYSSQPSSNSAQIVITPAQAGFTLSASPNSVTITQGGAAGTSTITVTSLNGFNSATTLSASGLPSGVTAVFNPNPVTPPPNGTVTSTLSLTASGTATTGTVTVTITGTSGSLTATTTLTLTVNAASSFTLSASPSSVTITQGGAAGTSTITVTSLNGFNSATTLSASGLPSGVTAVFSPNPVTPPPNGTVTSTLSLTASGTATTGTVTVTITGTSGSVTATTTLTLTVNAAPGFTLSASPSSVTITQGLAGVPSTIAVTDQGGFNGSVTLAASGVPSGVTAVFNPNPTTTTSTLTLTASTSATPGTATVTITGTSGSLNASTTLGLTVIQNFNVPGTLTPPLAANPGQSTTTTMLISPDNVGGTFTSNVTYTCSAGLPAGATCSFNPTQINSGTGATSVTITVQTSGPFSGAAGSVRQGETRRKLLGQKQRLWLPLTLPLAGVVFVGLAGRGMPRRCKIVGLGLTLALAGFLVACGSGSSSPPPITVSVSASPSSLWPNLLGLTSQTSTVTATVSGTTNTAVNWEVNGVPNGNSTFGTITGTGDTVTYNAPAALPSPASFNITAVSQADSSASGNAMMTIKTPTPPGQSSVTVTVTEGTAPPQAPSFTLTVN